MPPPRLACLEFPQPALQLLQRRDPRCRHLPAAVATATHGTGRIRNVCARAARAGIAPGQTVTAATQRCPSLRVAVITPDAVEAALAALIPQLQQWTPAVHRDPQTPARFWLDTSGLHLLFGDQRIWTDALQQALAHANWRVHVAAGGDRADLCILTQTTRCAVFARRDTARQAADAVPLTQLAALSPTDRALLAAAGITTVGQARALPRAELAARIQPASMALLCNPPQPLPPCPHAQPHTWAVAFEPAETNRHRLLFCLRRSLAPRLAALQAQRRSPTELCIHVHTEHRQWLRFAVRPAHTTRKLQTWSDLLRLQLEPALFATGVVAAHCTLTTEHDGGRQLGWRPQTTRDLQAAEHALARLQAAFGMESVGRIRPVARWLPAAQARWETTCRLAVPDPPPRTGGVVRSFEHPAPRIAPPAGQPLAGPFRLEGGWWRKSVALDEYLWPQSDGGIAWLYYDHQHHCWRRRGIVV